MHAGRGMMRAAGGETCAGIGVMCATRGAAPVETAVSRLPGAATELPGGLSHPARGAVRRPAGESPGPGHLMPNPGVRCHPPPEALALRRVAGSTHALEWETRRRPMTSRDSLHRLVDDLPETEIVRAERLLAVLAETAEPPRFTLENAPEDDEDEAPGEAAAVAEAWRDHREGKSLTTEEVIHLLEESAGKPTLHSILVSAASARNSGKTSIPWSTCGRNAILGHGECLVAPR